jgi:hypothetical protein
VARALMERDREHEGGEQQQLQKQSGQQRQTPAPALQEGPLLDAWVIAATHLRLRFGPCGLPSAHVACAAPHFSAHSLYWKKRVQRRAVTRGAGLQRGAQTTTHNKRRWHAVGDGCSRDTRRRRPHSATRKRRMQEPHATSRRVHSCRSDCETACKRKRGTHSDSNAARRRYRRF